MHPRPPEHCSSRPLLVADGAVTALSTLRSSLCSQTSVHQKRALRLPLLPPQVFHMSCWCFSALPGSSPPTQEIFPALCILNLPRLRPAGWVVLSCLSHQPPTCPSPASCLHIYSISSSFLSHFTFIWTGGTQRLPVGSMTRAGAVPTPRLGGDGKRGQRTSARCVSACVCFMEN